MKAETLDIVPLRQSHLQEAASLIAEAFVDEPGAVAVIKRSPEKRLRILRKYFGTQVSLILPQGACTCALVDGELAGVMVISAPDKDSLTTGGMLKFLLRMLFHTTPAIMWRGMKSALEDEANRPKEPNYCLETIAVHPKVQGRGFGGAMMSHLTDLADRQGVLTYLSTSDPKTVPFYEQCGFQVISKTHSLGIPNFHLVRIPNKL
jgi:GNAT superfamily N-acetyltransferase